MEERGQMEEVEGSVERRERMPSGRKGGGGEVLRRREAARPTTTLT